VNIQESGKSFLLLVLLLIYLTYATMAAVFCFMHGTYARRALHMVDLDWLIRPWLKTKSLC
jgi:hypothetical protein